MQYQTNEVVYEEYVVKPKDSLYSIAKEFKTTVAELTDINMLTTNVLYPNQVLLVPTHSKTLDITLLEYFTNEGDTMEIISNKVGVPIQTLGAYNDFGKVVRKNKLGEDAKVGLISEQHFSTESSQNTTTSGEPALGSNDTDTNPQAFLTTHKGQGNML